VQLKHQLAPRVKLTPIAAATVSVGARLGGGSSSGHGLHLLEAFSQIARSPIELAQAVQNGAAMRVYVKWKDQLLAGVVWMASNKPRMPCTKSSNFTCTGKPSPDWR
jgi:hypothetical protein